MTWIDSKGTHQVSRSGLAPGPSQIKKPGFLKKPGFWATDEAACPKGIKKTETGRDLFNSTRPSLGLASLAIGMLPSPSARN